MEALVLDGGVKSALATARALGRAGVRVTVLAERGTAPALHSRFTTVRGVYRSPLEDPAGCVDDIIAAAQACKEKPVIFSMSDATMLLLSRNRERILAVALVPLPSVDSLECAANKEKTEVLAQSLHIATIPHATFSKFPVVVKPIHSAVWVRGVGARGTASFAFSRSDVEERIDAVQSEMREAPLIQEYIQGEELGFEAICENGRVIASLAHRRIRSLSPTGGAAVVKETIDAPPMIRKASEELLKALSWTGVAMLEFKRDRTTGVYYLLEINPRFWGSLPLAIRAGLPFPRLYMALAHGDRATLTAGYTYTRGLATQHFLGDLKHLLRVWFSRDRMRALAYPPRMIALLSFLSATFRLPGDVFDWTDPTPSVLEIIDHL
jgi:predicted ATP-grasp superfamily ATP-dependent carboligase